MGGGIISLVANGAQDVYLTGDPHITYFKVIYRRYTNFAMETIEQPIDSAKPGGRYSVQVQRNGDLATKTCLRVRVPEVRADVLGTGTEKIAWVRRVGHALIGSVEVKIGGMSIDKHVGVWLDIYYELTHTSEAERGYRALIGDVDDLTTLRGRENLNDSNEVILPAYTLYIPFQFWFCRNYGLALPLIALQYHEVRIDLVLEEASKLLVWTGCNAPNLGNWSFRETGIMIDYVYLESGERRKYAQLGHEYLIEQVQFNGEENLQINPGSNSTNQKYKLTYNHPTKEIVWAVKVGAFNGEGNRTSFSGGRGKFLCYTNRDDAWETDALDYAAKNLAESCVFVSPKPMSGSTGTINGNCARAVEGADGNQRQKICVVVRNLAGQTNSLLPVWVYSTPTVGINLNLFGRGEVDLVSYIDYAKVVVTHYDGANIKIDCVEVKHRLTLELVSVPVEDMDFDNRSCESAKYTVHKDVVVTQPNNYGLRLDGKGNPVEFGNIQLNGHDRFKVQEGSYFNYYQTQNHHTRTPADGINVYSFALHPEKHQPSGTTNLSRIDSTILNLNFADRLRYNSPLKLDIGRDSRLYIFAYSYNVLRVMSGMAGLAYSN